MSHYPASPKQPRAIVFSLAIAAALGASSPDARAERRTFSVDAATLTQEAQSHFPQRSCLLGMVCVTISEPRVVLKPDERRIFVVAKALPQLSGQAMEPGTIEVAGVPRYDAKQGAFFLDEPVVSRAEFEGLAPSHAALAAQLVGGLLDEYLKTTPIHRLDEKDAKQSLAKLVLRSVAVRDGKLELTVGDDD